MTNRLEHANITVSNVKATADWLCDVFGWTIRWQGPAMSTGYTIHVGTDESYIALFSYGDATPPTDARYKTAGSLNHVGVFINDDIKTVEDRVRAAGFTPTSHQDYAPGHRFYFLDADGIEWEVASHQN
ncbi:MAG: VOC family protein [Pseudooceanicola sp.]